MSDPATDAKIKALEARLAQLEAVLSVSPSGVTMTSPGTLTITAGSGLALTAGGALSLTAGSTCRVRAGSHLGLDCGGRCDLTANGAVDVTAGAALEFNAGASASLSVAKDLALTVAGNMSAKADKSALLEATDGIAMRSKVFSIRSEDRVGIDGRDIALTASRKIDIRASSDVVIKGSRLAQN
ncbi:MAG: hypothetical protein ACRCXM_03010 [Beijerinckiaceae bacterium]